MKRIFVLSLLIIAQTFGFLALSSDSPVEVSLLTCSPGTKSYELYGHTALRVKHKTGADLVYNYGVFDFNRPAFTWHFILGECDYLVMPFRYNLFRDEYVKRGSGIISQRLNFTPQESARLVALLEENCKPENMVYRYDFYRNNCTTKVRDIVEEAVDGEIVYPEPHNHLMYHRRETYREMIHHYTANSKWCEVGQDLLLGCKSDTALSPRAMLFLPDYLYSAFAGAVIRSDRSDTRPLVLFEEKNLEKGTQINNPGFPLTPLQCSVIFFALMLFILALESFFACQFWPVDALLMTLQGVVGLLLCFLFLFSKHPTLDSNFQIWLFNPLPLIGMYFVIPAARKDRRTLWHGFNFAWLFFFILFIPWVPQDYAAGVFPVALGLMTRPVSYFLAYRRDE
ncbi:MAG: DUF4105 domain-containing protein [Bacteroidaceae bacterium]|nr:DUF4105 domain-containing protein [Bacteroidaceae bacterium]